jgi:hypothetical protein
MASCIAAPAKAGVGSLNIVLIGSLQRQRIMIACIKGTTWGLKHKEDSAKLTIRLERRSKIVGSRRYRRAPVHTMVQKRIGDCEYISFAGIA